MLRTPTRLSDGRMLVYYDEHPVDRTAHPDARELEPITSSSELRRDPLTGETVIIASHRQNRTNLPSTDQCPLCPTTGGFATEIPAPSYDVVVFENRFPSLAGDTGRCEVVCFSDDHDASFASLPGSRVRTIVDAWADRTAELARVPSVEHVFPFENRGREIGATISHPHGQIYAYPFVAPRWRTMLEQAREHRDRTGHNLFADVLADEQRDGRRVVASSEHWTAYVPQAARWPVELHVVPHRRARDLTELDDAERDDFAELYPGLLRRLDALYGVPLPYVAAWYQAPVSWGRDDAYLHLQVFSTRRAADKLKYLAGSESAMGVFINDVVPESMAERLRAATP
ncbi:galactose-1-phosphate uridylyltransferase [Jatrophihabitans fulvus]